MSGGKASTFPIAPPGKLFFTNLGMGWRHRDAPVEAIKGLGARRIYLLNAPNKARISSSTKAGSLRVWAISSRSS